MVSLSTLCYIEQNRKYLMLHRTVKKNDVNKDKWIGVGGHFELDESPEECLLREVREETGYELTSYRFRGLVTFVSGNGVTEYMSLFTADGFEGEPIPCNEGVLEWVDIEDVWKLNLWEGDKIFFRLLDERDTFFSLKFCSAFSLCFCISKLLLMLLIFKSIFKGFEFAVKLVWNSVTDLLIECFDVFNVLKP